MFLLKSVFEFYEGNTKTLFLFIKVLEISKLQKFVDAKGTLAVHSSQQILVTLSD